jgi:hypothetical protein
MIAFCRSYLVGLLKDTVKCTPVYTNPKDETRFKPLIFSQVLNGEEKLEKDYTRIAKEVDDVNKLLKYRYRVYKSTLPIFVSIVGKNLEQAENFRQTLLTSLPTRILDPDGNAISIEATDCNTIQEINDGSIQNPREGYEFTIMFYGGVYRDKTVNMLTGEVVPELEITKED